MISDKFISLIIISITFYELQLIVRDWIELLSCKKDRQFDNFVVIVGAVNRHFDSNRLWHIYQIDNIFPVYGQPFFIKCIML